MRLLFLSRPLVTRLFNAPTRPFVLAFSFTVLLLVFSIVEYIHRPTVGILDTAHFHHLLASLRSSTPRAHADRRRRILPIRAPAACSSLTRFSISFSRIQLTFRSYLDGIMPEYVDKAVQTTIAGLARHPAPKPAVLFDNTTTPPEEMPSKSRQHSTDAMPSITQTQADAPDLSPTILLGRKKRPNLVTRISLPEADFPGARSPPPTEAVMSPLPAANRLHAGHTPIFPRALSPLRRLDKSGESTASEQEEYLTGPLMLPPQPGDGAGDRIELKALDAELEKIAKERSLHRDEPGSSPSQPAEHRGHTSRRASEDVAGQRRSSTEEVEVDGVILKKPKMNFGAPLGQA
jgi:hypothetical protein